MAIKLHCIKGDRGFSLVEVVMAIGIIAFAMVGLVGIMPAGLKAAEDSARQTAQSHIVMAISGDLTMLPFSEVEQYVNTTRYYDYEGRVVDSASAAIFVVTMEKLAPNYPASSDLNDLEDRMVRVAVNFRRQGEAASRAKRVTLSVVNNGVS